MAQSHIAYWSYAAFFKSCQSQKLNTGTKAPEQAPASVQHSSILSVNTQTPTVTSGFTSAINHLWIKNAIQFFSLCISFIHSSKFNLRSEFDLQALSLTNEGERVNVNVASREKRILQMYCSLSDIIGAVNE